MQYELPIHRDQPSGQRSVAGSLQNLLPEKLDAYPAAGDDCLLLHSKHGYGMRLGAGKRIEDEQYGNYILSNPNKME